MINTLLNLVDRILQLLRLRASRKERLFTKLWQPTFQELQRVHTNYVEMLESCAGELEVISACPDNEEILLQVEGVIKKLRINRLKYEPVRRHLLAIIDEAKNYDYDSIEQEYVSSLTHYFPSITNRGLSTHAAESLSRLEALRDVLTSNEYEPQRLSDSVQNTSSEVKGALRKMRVSWDKVCKTYSALQNENARLDVN